MTKQEMAELVESLGANIPERLSGNDENAILAGRLGSIVQTERTTLVALLRDWISLRLPQKDRKPGDGTTEGRMWFALEMARRYSLNELRPDIECLVDDVRSGDTYLAYYAEMIKKYLDELSLPVKSRSGS